MFASFLLISGLLLGQAAVGDDAKSGGSGPAPSQAATEPKPDPKLAAEVRRLVRQLDAPQLRERIKAEQDLLKFGPALLELLPKETDPSKPEVAQRIGRIRQQLERAAAESTLHASLVTLEGEFPVSKILAAIHEQTGNKILDARREAGDDRDPMLKVQFDKTPFWQALDQVLDQAKLTIYPFGEEKAVKVLPQTIAGGGRSQRASYSGPFRIEPLSVLAQRDLRSDTGGSLKLRIEISWEPRLAPVTLQQRMGDLRVVDENGQPLVIQEREADLEVPVEPGTMAKEIVLPLALPPRGVVKIARLQGKIKALVPGKTETFRFTDLEKAKNVERPVAGVTVTLEEVRKVDKLWRIRTLLQFNEASGALASHRATVFNNPAYLEDKEGKRVDYDTSESTRQTANELGVAYLFFLEKPLSDFTFVYQSPAMIFAAPFEYELKDIALP